MGNLLLQVAEAATGALDNTGPLIIVGAVVSSAIVALSLLYMHGSDLQIDPAWIRKYRRFNSLYFASWVSVIISILFLTNSQPVVIIIPATILILCLAFFIYLAVYIQSKSYKFFKKQAKAMLGILDIIPMGSLAFLSWLLFSIVPANWVIKEQSYPWYTPAIPVRCIYALFVCVILVLMICHLFHIGFRLFNLIFQEEISKKGKRAKPLRLPCKKLLLMLAYTLWLLGKGISRRRRRRATWP